MNTRWSSSRRALVVCTIMSGFLLSGRTAFAARLANEVERSFVIRGDVARVLIGAFGLLPGTKNKVEFLVNEGWVCKADKSGPDACGQETARKNRLVLVDRSEPEVVLEGVFIDATTGSGEKVPRYTACTAPASLEALRKTSWGAVLPAAPAKGKDRDVVFSTSDKLTPLFQVIGWWNSDGATVTVCMGFDDASPADREKVEREFEECTRRLEGADGGC